MELKFANQQEAIKYLEDFTDSKVIIEKKRIASFPKENLDKMLFYIQDSLSHAKKIPVRMAYGIGYFQKHPELVNSIDINKCIEAERLASELYELLNDIEAQVEEERGQISFDLSF